MKSRAIKIILSSVFILLVTSLVAQDKEEKKDKKKIKVHPSLSGVYQAGGILTSDNFVFQNGLGVELMANFEMDSRVYYGFGTGFETLNDDRMIPLIVDVKGFLKKEKPCFFFTGQLGYAFMWNDHYSDYNSYDYEGGIRFAGGVGYRIPFKMKKDAMLLFSATYKQQYATINYDGPADDDYSDRLSFNLLALKMGFLF